MRIERVQIREFGRLRGIDTGRDALPGLIVVLGPNEAGKSTLFHFLTTALFGFHPATREGNPYIPWGSDEAGGSIDLRLDDGACLQVDRRLRSQPTGKLIMDGRTDDLRNRSLPWADHVPFRVFRQVFAVTLGDLAGLDEETWAGIQDRILGAMGATDVVPARRVAEQLEAEAGALWRPTRRGNQRVRDLQDEVRALRARRSEALERDRRLRDVVEERDRARDRLEEARRERHLERAVVDRVQSLIPVRAQVRRIAALRDEAGPPDLLDALPADPTAYWEDLRARALSGRQRLEELTADLVEPQRAVAAVGDGEEALLNRADEISAFLARAAGSASDRVRLQELEQGIAEVERRLDGAAAQWLSTSWRDVSVAQLEGVPHADLRDRVRRFMAAREQRRILESAATQEFASTAPTSFVVGAVALLVSGAALLALGLPDRSPIPIALGGAAAAVGVAFLVLWARLRAGPARASTSTGDAGRQVQEAEDGALRQVADLLEGLPVRPEVLSDPGEFLVPGVERMRELLADRRDRERTSQDMKDRTAATDGEAAALGHALGLEPGLSTEAVIHVLGRELQRCERLKEAADAGQREIRRLRREQGRLEAELHGFETESEQLQARFASLADGDAQRGAHLASERLQAALRAAELQDELERAHPDLQGMVARISEAEAAGESWTMDDEDLANRRARIDALDEEVNQLTGSAEALDRDAAHLLQEETVDAVDGEVASLKEEEARLVRERDRAWVLAQLVREADRRFREEHQPDLVRRAGSYLGHLTGGRYDRMLVDDVGDEGVFQIVGPSLPAPIPLAHPVSTGTLEQAYLALRLAIVDHLDRGGERLPLFVDEVFVNWDDARRARGVDLLASVSKSRQLFFFTCHPEMAATLEARGAKVIPLAEEGA